MLRSALRVGAFAVALVVLPKFAAAAPITIDFESFQDFDDLTTQIPGLSFSNAIVSSTIPNGDVDSSGNPVQPSLLADLFPPRSGATVLSDIGGPITIDFNPVTLSFSGFFTYFTFDTGLSLTGFDSAGNVVATAVSAFFNNVGVDFDGTPLGDPGSSPNEFLELLYAGGLSSVVIAGFPDGSSFTMDDMTYNPVPEPATMTLLMLGGAGLIAARRRRSKRATRG
jgi:hypothetical protein